MAVTFTSPSAGGVGVDDEPCSLDLSEMKQINGIKSFVYFTKIISYS